MRGLYAIVDHGSLGALGVDVLAFARAVLAAGPAAVQLRAKALGAGQTLALLRALSPLCRDAGALLFAASGAAILRRGTEAGGLA